MKPLPTMVIVLDDDEDFQQAVIRLLQASGIAAMGTPNMNGLEDAFPLRSGTCILADIMLIGESGLDVPALLAARGQTAPVVFISATDDDAKMVEAARLAGAACLRKPVEVGDLHAALADAMLRFAEGGGNRSNVEAAKLNPGERRNESGEN